MAKMLLEQTEEWFARNRQEFIHCPHQPGNLMITRSGCRQRRDRAKKETFDDITKGDFFEYMYKSGLLVCRDCRVELKRPSREEKVIPFHRRSYAAVNSIQAQRAGA